MTIIDLLASSQGLKGNEPNVALAKKIARSESTDAIKELVCNLKNEDKKVRSDCIKTLYEIGYLKPGLIADYYTEFLELLTNKNNRLVWGGMIAISSIADLKVKEIFASLDTIMETVDKGSVITKDCGVEILAKLNCHKDYFNKTDALLLDQLWKCPIKQLPMYAEKAVISINEKNKDTYRLLIDKRKAECETSSQIRRLEKVLKQIDQF